MPVQEFFHRPTGTLTYVVSSGPDAVVIDPCLDFEFSEMKISRESLNSVIAYVREKRLTVHWILETHVHADHLSGAAVLKSEFSNARVAISEKVCGVQQVFRELFAFKDDHASGWPFDRLLIDGDTVDAGALRLKVIATPGHTPACMSFVCHEGMFTGDSLFMPQLGTGRCDFPGGDAKKLFESIQRLYQFKDGTPVFVGHSYPAADQPPEFRSTIGEEKTSNVHVKVSSKIQEFVVFRGERDRKLGLPKLFYPSLFINMRGGHLPEEDAKGRRFMVFPVSASL